MLFTRLFFVFVAGTALCLAATPLLPAAAATQCPPPYTTVHGLHNDAAFGHARWSYTSFRAQVASTKDQFIAGEAILLEFLASSDEGGHHQATTATAATFFSASSDCTFAAAAADAGAVWNGGITNVTSTSLRANITCSTGGDKCFGIARTGREHNETDWFHIQVVERAGHCYAWYLGVFPEDEAIAPRTGGTEPMHLLPAHTDLSVRIWVVDPSSHHSLSPEEAAWTAKRPSARSAQLSREFFFSGESPSLDRISLAGVAHQAHPALVDNDGDDDLPIVSLYLAESVFHEHEGYWTSKIETREPGTVAVRILGRDIYSLACTVVPTARQFYVHNALLIGGNQNAMPPPVERYMLNSTEGQEVLHSISDGLLTTQNKNGSVLRIEPAACLPQIQAFVVPHAEDHGEISRSFVYTEDEWRSFGVASVPVQTGEGLNDSVRDVVLTSTSLLVLVPAGVLVLHQNATRFEPIIALSVDADRMHVATNCDLLLDRVCDHSLWNQFVVVWEKDNGTVFHLSRDGGASFEEVIIPVFNETRQLLTVDEEFVQLSSMALTAGVGGNVLVALVRTNVSDILLVYRLSSGVWHRGAALYDPSERLSLIEEGLTSTVAELLAPSVGGGELLAYGASLHYSRDGGLSLHQLELVSRDPARPLASNDVIEQTLAAPNGVKLVVVTNTRRLFVGILGSQTLIEIQSSSPRMAAVLYSFRGAEDLFISTFGQNYTVHSDAHSRVANHGRLPLLNEIRSPREPVSANPVGALLCPYFARENTLPNASYIDMNEAVEIAMSVVSTDLGDVSPASISVTDQTRFSTSTRRTVRKVSDTVVGQGAAADTSNAVLPSALVTHFEHNVVVQLREAPARTQSRSERVLRGQGSAAFRFAPSSLALGCEEGQIVSAARVGCPPGRHIRIRHTQTCNNDPVDVRTRNADHDETGRPLRCGSAWFEALHEAASSGGSTSESLLFGCPLRVWQQTNGFRPVIDLYDGEDFVEEVFADYVVWELTDRTDFSYNATISGVNCKSKPLSWNEVLSRPGGDRESWTPEVHRPCFDEDPSRPIAQDQVYEVLNAGVNNYIVFPIDGDDGMFYFKLRVVDPRYSFCDLTAVFAVDTFGAAMDALELLLVVAIVTLVIGFALMLSYFQYRRTVLRQTKKKRE